MQESDENDFSSKRKEKIAELNEICDFVTIDYVQGQEVYYCHKNGSRVRSNKSTEQQLVIEGDSEEVNEKENIEAPTDG